MNWNITMVIYYAGFSGYFLVLHLIQFDADFSNMKQPRILQAMTVRNGWLQTGWNQIVPFFTSS